MSIQKHLEAIWREYRLSLIAALTRIFRDLELAEDCLSDAFVSAQSDWAANGLPDRPDAWLYTAALRKGRDRLRKKARHATKSDEVNAHMLQTLSSTDKTKLPEARLGLFFMCAHPALSPEAQTALILFHMGGVSAERIAASFLTTPATIHQRLKRARDKLKANAVGPDIPDQNNWPDRLTVILAAIEIIYSQSYDEIGGGVESAALGQDALQLAATLTIILPDETEVHALCALLHFLEARRSARLDQDGMMIPLDRQDPTRWSAKHLKQAAQYVSQAARCMSTSKLAPGQYAIRAHIEATRSSKPAGRPRAVEMQGLYRALLEVNPSPVVGINYALTIKEAIGPTEALAELEAISQRFDASGFAPWHLACANCLEALDRKAEAIFHLNAAMQLINGRVERAFIASETQRLQQK